MCLHFRDFFLKNKEHDLKPPFIFPKSILTVFKYVYHSRISLLTYYNKLMY
jgi:hypothetical protein